jgi:hypothetical protein
MKHQAIPVVVVCLGVVLTIASFALPALTGRAQWTEENEAEFNAAAMEYYGKAHGHSHDDSQGHAHAHSHGNPQGDAQDPTAKVSQAEIARITDEFNKQVEKVDAASSRGRLLAKICWWSGLLLLAAGAGIVFVQNIATEGS